MGSKKNLTMIKTPISKLGEREVLLKATVLAGLSAGGSALLWIVEDGWMIDILSDWGTNLVDKKRPNVKGPKKLGFYLGATAALIGGFVAAVAAVYTLYKTPNIMYEGKVKAFTKGKDMDVYIKGNKVERELYDLMLEKVQNATKEEKKGLSQQYLKLRAAKNPVPEFVKDETNVVSVG